MLESRDCWLPVLPYELDDGFDVSEAFRVVLLVLDEPDAAVEFGTPLVAQTLQLHRVDEGAEKVRRPFETQTAPNEGRNRVSRTFGGREPNCP